MMTFVGTPVIEFFNYQTKENVSLMGLVDYANYDDEIEVKTVSLPEKAILAKEWLKDWNGVFVKVKFVTYQTEASDTIETDYKKGSYVENYRLLAIDKPFVSNSSCDSISEFKTRMKVERL